ncbi:MAG: LamG domain-containing protein, partial [Candidatus Colwellbacteria bacterium]|nr:LamG domain-containing protein [Candidatus Colwellbacteria bacterium]
PVSRDPSLVGYWPFEGYGSIADLQTSGLEDYSGYGNNGTADNTNGLGMSFVSGKVGSAVQFDGVDDYVGTPSLSDISETSWVVWVKPFSTDEMHVIKCNISSNYMVANIFDRAFRIRTFTGSGDIFASTGLLPVNQWSLLSMTYTNPGIKIYLNGILENSISSYVLGNLNNSYYFGNYGGEEPLFSGLIDEIKIYKRALSASEIKALYDAGK